MLIKIDVSVWISGIWSYHYLHYLHLNQCGNGNKLEDISTNVNNANKIYNTLSSYNHIEEDDIFIMIAEWTNL